MYYAKNKRNDIKYEVLSCKHDYIIYIYLHKYIVKNIIG